MICHNEKHDSIIYNTDQDIRKARFVAMKKENLQKLLEKVRSLWKQSGRRALALIGAVALIGSAVVLNFMLFREEPENQETETDERREMAVDLSQISEDGDILTSAAAADGDYFESVSLGRQRARDEAMEVLKEVTESETSDTTSKESAMADINRIAGEIEKEANIEAMVTSKGFERCIALVNGDSANVIVKSDTLTPGEAAQISEIVYEAAGILPANLKIIEKSDTES